MIRVSPKEAAAAIVGTYLLEGARLFYCPKTKALINCDTGMQEVGFRRTGGWLVGNALKELGLKSGPVTKIEEEVRLLVTERCKSC